MLKHFISSAKADTIASNYEHCKQDSRCESDGAGEAIMPKNIPVFSVNDPPLQMRCERGSMGILSEVVDNPPNMK